VRNRGRKIKGRQKVKELKGRVKKIKGRQKVKELKGKVKKISQQVSVRGRGSSSCALPSY